MADDPFTVATVSIGIEDVRLFLALEGLEDSAITPHLESAKRKITADTFPSEEAVKEAVACQTIANVAVLVWARVDRHLNEYDEHYQSFSDVTAFEQYWQRRANDVLRCDDSPVSGGGISIAVV